MRAPDDRALADFGSRARASPEAIAVVDADGNCRTRSQVFRLANRLAHALRACGLTRGDVIALICENRVEFLAMYLAAMDVGLRLLPVNIHLTPEEVAYLLEDSGARAIVVDGLAGAASRSAQMSAHELPAIRISIGELPGFVGMETFTAGFPDCRLPDPEVGQVMHYTSATTGRPKGVQRSLDRLRPGWESYARSLTSAGVDLGERNVHLCASMLYHRAPLDLAIVALHMGHTVVLSRRPDAESILQLVETHAVTTGFMSPAMFVRLLKLPESVRQRYSTASLKWIMHGGAPSPVEVKRRMIEWWGPVLWDDYGSSESGNLTLCGSHEWLLRPGTVGRPATGVTLKILDDEGRELPCREVGLVYVSCGAGWSFEYRGDPEKTRRCHRGAFFTAGDLGYLDEEGYLFLCDRANDMVVSGGTNLYPAEIEQILVLHPQVADCAVFGVPDELMGEAIVAVVQTMPGAGVGPQLTLDILKFLRCRLSAFKLPRKIAYASIPRDPSGKLRKTRLREEWLRARANPPAAAITPADILADLNRAGIHLSVTGDELHYRAPAGAMTAERLDRIRSGRESLIDLLSSGSRSSDVKLVPREHFGVLPAAAVQSFFARQYLHMGTDIAHLAMVMRVAGDPGLDRFRSALASVVERHLVLRMRFTKDPDWSRVFVDRQFEPSVQVVDLARIGERRRMRLAEGLTARVRRRHFDLRTGPLFRVCALRMSDSVHIVVIVVHHSICDYRSLEIFRHEFAARLANARGAPRAADFDSLQFTDVTQWQLDLMKDPGAAGHVEYWKRQLSGITSGPWRHGAAPGVYLPAAEYGGRLDPDLVKDLLEQAASAAASLPILIITAISVALHRLTGDREVLLCILYDMRVRPELSAMIGCLVEGWILRADLSGQPSLRTMIGRVREQCLRAYAHLRVPFRSLLDEIGMSEIDPLPLPILNYVRLGQTARTALLRAEASRAPATSIDLLDWGSRCAPVGPAPFINFFETQRELIWRVCQSQRLLEGSADAFSISIGRVLEALVRCPDLRLTDIELPALALNGAYRRMGISRSGRAG